MALMAPTWKWFILIVATVNFCGLSCGRREGPKYAVDKISPTGGYRVKVEFVRAGPKGTREYAELGKFQFFKGQDIIHTYTWENSDNYEPSTFEPLPVIEWVGDNVLRTGEDASDQPFHDELIVSNNSDENLKYMALSYGRFESFWIFDLAPGNQIRLHASPGFKPDGSSVWFLGYGGETQNGKKFEGTMDGKKRESPSNGPLRFSISINAKDLRS